MKQKQRDRMQPKVGKLDIDYQVLHDAFFKHQTKPHLTLRGETWLSTLTSSRVLKICMQCGWVTRVDKLDGDHQAVLKLQPPPHLTDLEGEM